MRALSDRTSELLESKPGDFDVVVVGSGYGAGVCAARLAEAGLKVCVLERGREIATGSFPKTLRGVRAETQVNAPHLRSGSRLGLYDVRVNPELSVLLGCGLGGTSLINANVTIIPDETVFAQPAWPKSLRASNPCDPDDGMFPYFRRAWNMLRPSPFPDAAAPSKLRALERSAKANEFPFQRANINVNFADRSEGPDGTPAQSKCTNCGNCVTGCNHGAKNTLCYTYLPLAKRARAKIFTQCPVRYVAKRPDGRYDVHYQHLRSGDEGELDSEHCVTAPAVVLGAGALGSTEILLRSAARGLDLSPQVGRHFSGNGDGLAIGYNCENEGRALDSVGFGRWRKKPPVGPAIMGLVDLRGGRSSLTERIIIEEGVFPGPLAAALRWVAQIGAGAVGVEAKAGVGAWLAERWRELLDLLGLHPLDGALNHSQVYLVMGHDGSSGELVLDPMEHIRVQWPGLKDETVFRQADRATHALTTALRGMHVPNPLWKAQLFGNLMTVHPLGGCVMGDDADKGGVNEFGQVYAGDGRVHEKLFVADGAIVPMSLGVNPLLTITLLAERVADKARSVLTGSPCPPT